MKDTYPQILMPEEVLSIKRILPPIPDEPEKPKFPEKKIPIAPKEPIKPMNFGSALLSLIVLFGLGILLMAVIPVLGIFLVGTAVYLIFSWTKNWTDIHDKYNEDYQQFLQDCKVYKASMDDDEFYNKEILYYKDVCVPKYISDYREYFYNKQRSEQQPAINEFRIKELTNYFTKAVKPSPNDSNSNNYKKGVTEQYFLQYLKENFKDNVHTNLTITDPNFEGIPYQPDYVILDPSINLFIDIEIDEPYIGSDGTPIHYLGGNDEKRNIFFLKNRWVVIHFAEIQVVKYPQKCCHIIQLTINWLINPNSFDIKTIEQRIENFNCWNKDEAYRLAFTRFRNKYLPQDLSEKIEYEMMELEKRFLNLKMISSKDDLPF